MIRKLLPAVLAAALIGPAFASETLSLDQATEDKIRTSLTAEGYEVRKIEVEDGMYEAYALKDGEKFEIYLDASLHVVKVEKD